ncbi:MaoC family dehydratase [Cupriavidus consociatus]|uniref:MaoC family dehydratase n=1 Tax=Cupriavidus consociatus TaxID=2821357 RepID=UPI001AE198FA|nr:MULTISPECIES: MaoC family dehydratase [unclassified Cupriavidus]MBP0623200.1 MaoC family dehydratase [Cupriavidus sp. LEh25]MDK2659893.1 MaoC family dehydratase [Cupriavidus sp. LEh21]
MHSIASLDDLRTLCAASTTVSNYFPVDQDAIDTFAELTNDRQWIHVDPTRAAAESPYGCTIAHGFLILSMVSGAFAQCFSFPSRKFGLNYGFDRLRFTGPVPAGARVRSAFTLQQIDDIRPGEVRCHWKVEMQVEGSERPAMVAVWLVQMRF